jgi:hypothetical protein
LYKGDLSDWQTQQSILQRRIALYNAYQGDFEYLNKYGDSESLESTAQALMLQGEAAILNILQLAVDSTPEVPDAPIVSNMGPGVAAMSRSGPESLTLTEAADIQAIANDFRATLDVVGSRAENEGRNILTDLPIGKDPFPGANVSRSDIDFRMDITIESAEDLVRELKAVGNGAGSAGMNPKWSTAPPPLGRPTEPPFIRFSPQIPIGP